MTEKNTNALNAVKERLGVPRRVQSCHTAEVGGYVVEGHVPADVVRRLLEEQPADVVGIGVGGMPIGSPGMEVSSGRVDPYDIMAWDRSGRVWIYERR